ncbi:MAG: DUF882 domain-containing protein [Phyllobacteriaceae bacterium]|nr:DUF882 domain-containing protein [Phyllobacteriaceae bacterium]
MARLALVALMTLSAALLAAPAQAATERALYIHYTHTKETARIVFKRNGQYVQSGLNELNVFLRDWRRNEPAKMDPRLFDLVWEVYQEVGGTQPIHVVSAYRSPATNAMLAKTSSGVADNSQHMRGTAMDFYIPGVPLTKLRAAAMRKQVGGVGYYPTSGSPFVHLDTGSVRAWPRMTRAQLKELFPDGRTMHLPNDGKPLSQEGYQIALNEWKRCHAYPCNGSSSGTAVASNSGGGGRTLMDVLFGGNDNASAPQTQVASAPAPTVQTASLVQPRSIAPVMPAMRPADLGGPTIAAAEAQQVAAVAAVPSAPVIPFSTSGSAPLTPEELGQTTQVASVALPVMMPADLRGSMASGESAVTAIAAATAVAMPTPRVNMSNPPSETLSAYLPTNAPDPEAQRALEMIISTSTTASVTPAPSLPRLDPRPVIASAGLTTAALAPQTAAPASDLFNQTFGATESAAAQPLAAALAQHVAKRDAEPAMRQRDLVAPDLDHVADIFTAPVPLNSTHFAVIFDHDEADFDPATEMGKHVLVKGVGDMAPTLGNRFSVN